MDQDHDQPITTGTEKGIGSRGIVVGSLTGCSRVLGLLRTIAESKFLGASATPIADAFFLAFRVPNFFRRLTAEGAFAQAFIPVLAQFQETGTREELEEFVQVVAGNFGLVLLVVCVLGSVFAPAFITIFTVGSTHAWVADGRFDLATGLLVVMFPYLGLISFTAFLGSVLNSFDRFFVPAFVPVILNVAMICAMLFGTTWFAELAYALAWAVIVAGVIQLLWHFPSLASLRLLKVPKVNWRSPGVTQMLKLFGPAVFAASVGQINILVGTQIAASLVMGSVAWLYYADRLIELPVGMIAIALQTVILPSISKLHNRGDQIGFRRHLLWGAEVGIILGLPAAVGLFVLATPLTTTLFLRGEFTWEDVQMVAVALQAFAVGVVPLMLVKIFAPGFFAKKDTKTPFYYASISVAVNILVSLSLFQFIHHVGIAIATTVAAFVHATLLMVGLMRRGDFKISQPFIKVCLQVAIASGCMVVVLHVLSPADSLWLDFSVWVRILWLAVLIGAGMVSYFVVGLVIGIRPRHLVGPS
ncbi:MAG: murein biosynthesis integral membrane protein MurJ [Gammaproteobacteria bacterium]|nr:murein biosynthesis integral membrane protein MurJ [Gammaproteobacteria bacterium]MYC24667.1 murein biosynthesis integral membrane protein MurJ [Gammaproteobacteria bacterium]